MPSAAPSIESLFLRYATILIAHIKLLLNPLPYLIERRIVLWKLEVQFGGTDA